MKEQDDHVDFASVKNTRGEMAVESTFTLVSCLPPQRYLSFYVPKSRIDGAHVVGPRLLPRSNHCELARYEENQHVQSTNGCHTMNH